MINKYLSFSTSILLKHPLKILASFIIITIFFGYYTCTQKIYLSIDYLLDNNNPRITTFNEILDEFGNDSNILLLNRFGIGCRRENVRHNNIYYLLVDESWIVARRTNRGLM